MTLRHDPDITAASWIVADGVEAGGDGADLWTRVVQGPPGFAAYATVRFDADPESRTWRADPDVVAAVTRLAAGHTTTPERVWFALWEGWAELEGGRAYTAMDPHRLFGRFLSRAKPVDVPPAFSPEVLAAPRADLAGWRSYLLFTGAADDVGDWGARAAAPGWPRDLPQASFTWPADHAWCIASDVDPDWFCIGGSTELVDAVLAHPDLDAEPSTYGSPPPLPD